MSVVTRRAFLGGLTAAAAAPWHGLAQTPAPPRLMILITLDTLRRGHLQTYGYSRPTSPNLAALAQRGFRFTKAFTHANDTQTSHAVMLSGLYSHVNQSYRNLQRWSLPPGHQTLAQVLAAQDVRTRAIVSFGALTKQMIGDGFESFGGVSGRERRAAATNEVAFDELATVPKGDRAFFWLHYFDAHEPYDPPADYTPPFSRRGYSTRGLYEYDAEISYLDHHLGKLFDFLRARGLYDDAAVFVTCDHGEHFGETPGLPLESHYGLYEYILEAPLLLSGGWVERWRAARRLPGTCDQLVSSGITVMPTLLEWAGVRNTQSLSGYSLLPVLDGRERSPGAHLAESDSQIQIAIRSSRYKLIVLNSKRYEDDLVRLARKDPNVYVTARIMQPLRDTMTSDGLELYDLQADPRERTNLANRERTIADQYLRVFAQMRDTRGRGAKPLPPDSDRLDILRSLGYIK